MSAEVTVRLLGPGDQSTLESLVRQDGEFDLDGRGGPLDALGTMDVEAYLGDPSILHWVAELETNVVGELVCYVQALSAGEPRELLLYDVGVHTGYRRRGIGRRLISVMDAWMVAHDVPTVGYWLIIQARNSFTLHVGFNVTRHNLW